MADDKNKQGPADGKRVNVNQAHELAYWTKKFGCTEQQLKDCVITVGVMAADVERCLRNLRSRPVPCTSIVHGY
jgi:hypothetical protein